jgi:hypothetical protein
MNPAGRPVDVVVVVNPWQSMMAAMALATLPDDVNGAPLIWDPELLPAAGRLEKLNAQIEESGKDLARHGHDKRRCLRTAGRRRPCRPRRPCVSLRPTARSGRADRGARGRRGRPRQGPLAHAQSR